MPRNVVARRYHFGIALVSEWWHDGIMSSPAFGFPEGPSVFEFTPGQAALLASTGKEILFGGGRGSGITTGLTHWLSQPEGPGYRGLLIKSHRMDVRDMGLQLRSKGYERLITAGQPWETYRLKSGGLLSVSFPGRHLDGRKFHRVAIDSASEIPNLESLLGLAHNGSIVFGGSPCGVSSDWLKNWFFVEKRGQFIPTGTWEENPGMAADPSFGRALIETEKDEWIRGDWTKAA